MENMGLDLRRTCSGKFGHHSVTSPDYSDREWKIILTCQQQSDPSDSQMCNRTNTTKLSKAVFPTADCRGLSKHRQQEKKCLADPNTEEWLFLSYKFQSGLFSNIWMYNK